MARIKEEDLRLNLIINGDETRKKMSELKSTITDTTKKLTDLEKERKKVIKQYGEESVQIKQLDERIDAHRKGIQNLKKNYEEYERRLSITGMTMKELSQHIRNVSAIMRNLVPGTEEWKKYSQELAKCKERMRELKGQAGDVRNAMGGLSKSLTKAAGVIGAAVIVVQKIKKVFSGVFNTIKDFEQANVNLSTILGTNVNAMRDLTNQAMALGATTKYTASEVTGLQTELAKLGFTQGEILQMTSSILNFGTAVGSDLAESAALAGATLRMFDLNASRTEDVMGTLALATNKSALNFSYLQTSMSIVGPVAKTFGFSVKDTVALLGTLANSGFDASSSATATRNIILKLADANGDLAKALGKPVKTFPDLIDGLKTLNAKGVDLATTLELTDKRSVAAFSAFLAGADSASILRDELEDTDGVLQDIADKRMNTLAGSVDSLKSAWERFTLSISNSKGIFKDAIDWVTDLVRAATPEDDEIVDTQKRTADYVASLVGIYGIEEEGVKKIQETIAEDRQKMERELKNAEAALEDASGIIARRRAQARVDYWAQGLAVTQGANKEFSDYLQWTAGTYSNTNSGSGGSGGNGGGGGGKDKHKQAWSLQSDENYLAAKAELTRQFNEGEIKSQEEFEEQLYQIELSALNARLALGKEKGTERRKIEADIQDRIMKHAEKVRKQNEERAKKEAEEKKKIAELEKAYLQVFIAVSDDHEEKAKAQEKAENARYKEELEKYRAKRSELTNYQQIVETLERQHQNNLRKIRLDAMEAERKDLEAQHKINLAAIQERYAYELKSASTKPRDKANMNRDNAHDMAAENVAYLQAQAFSLQRIVSSGTANGNLDGLKLSNQELQKYQLQLLETLRQLKEAQAQLDGLEKKSPGQMLKDMFVGTGNGSFLGVSQSDWDLLFQNIDEGTIGAKDLGTTLTAVGSAAKEGMKIATQAIGTVNAREKKAFDDWSKLNDKKKSDLEKSLAAGLVTQAQYNAEVEQMEADKASREEEMKLTQAKREKTMALIQAAINTALSVTKTIAQFGIPAGIAPAAIAATLGAAQIALIASKPVGYAGGGKVQVKRAQDGRSFRAEVEPEKRGYVGRPTILVGEEGGEYVIPAEGVKNPSLAPILATIESARKQGTLRNLDFGAIYPEGRAAGGRFIQTDQPSQSPVDLSGISSTLSEIQSLLETIRKSPIPAYLPIVGKNGMDKQVKKYNQYRETGKLQ